jgi:hypothetical protein
VQELDDAAEGLEKYLMNKMYKQCFQPARSEDAERDTALTDRWVTRSPRRPCDPRLRAPVSPVPIL